MAVCLPCIIIHEMTRDHLVARPFEELNHVTSCFDRRAVPRYGKAEIDLHMRPVSSNTAPIAKNVVSTLSL